MNETFYVEVKKKYLPCPTIYLDVCQKNVENLKFGAKRRKDDEGRSYRVRHAHMAHSLAHFLEISAPKFGQNFGVGPHANRAPPTWAHSVMAK